MTLNIQFWLLLLISVGFSACGDLDFNMTTYDVHVSIDPVDGGIVSPSTDTFFVEGTEVMLEVQNKEGFAFLEWSGDITGEENPVTFIIRDNYDVTAHFVKKTYELAIENRGRGEVFEQIVQSKSYEHGTVVGLTARPGEGYEFVRWTGDLNSRENPETILMDEPKNVEAVFEVKNTSAVIDVTVDWSRFNRMAGENGSSISDSLSHFGVHLLYEQEEVGPFNRSVARAGSDQSVLSLETTAAGLARLLATAVRDEEGREKAFFFGVIDEIDIEFGTQYDWELEDFKWRKASWRVVDSLAVDFEEGVFIKDRNDFPFELWILVNTPYRTARNVKIEDLFVRVSDGGAADPDTFAGESGYTDGFREFFIRASNLNRPQPDTTHHSFYPYLTGEKFALPSQRYLVDRRGRFSVVWQ